MDTVKQYINESFVDFYHKSKMKVFVRFFFIMLSSWMLCCDALPSYIKQCSKNSNLSDCIKENFEAIRPYLGEGVPELHLEPLNPWVYPNIKMEIPLLKFTVYDAHIWRMDTVVIKELDVNLDEGIVEMKLNYPYTWGECKYHIDGNLFMYQLKADGYGNGSVTDVDVTLSLRGTPKVVEGRNYMEFEKTGFTWTINGGATVYFKDAFPGSPFLSDAFNRAVNFRAVKFYTIIKPIMEVISTKWVEKAVKGVFSSYSLEELFLD